MRLESHNGVLTSARDLARWEIALAGGKVLRASSLAEMWTPLTFADGTRHNFGFAWWTSINRLGRRSISHSGATGADYSRYPDDNLTIIVLGNLGRFMSTVDVDAWGLTSGIAEIFIPGLSIRTLKEQPDTAGLAPRMRALLDEVASGGELELMVPRLRAGVTPIGRKVLAHRMAKVTDFRFVACEDAQARNVERFGVRAARSCYFRMTSPDEVRYYTFHLAADGRVVDYGSFLD